MADVQLTPQQAQAVTNRGGSLLVSAAAGSGKTKVLVEQVFSWPGLGLMTMSAITSRDYPVIMGVCLFTAVVVLLGNLVTDILYAVADPTISFQKGGKK